MATNILIQTLIVTLLTATCFGQSSLRVDEPQWWFNPQHAPLRFQLPPSKYNLLVTNYSDKTIAKYQLGCVLVTEGSFAKTFNVWPFEKAERLLPATKDNLFFEGIDDKFNNAKICLKGKLAVVSVYFSDGSKYSIQETRNNDLELVMNLGSRDKKISFHAAKEIFARGEKMIPLLIANKGNRDPFAWGSLGDPNGGSITFAPGGNPEWEEGRIVTVDVASMYLICAIYRQNFEFGQSGYLRSDEEVPFLKYNTVERVNEGWEAIEKWIEKLNAEGITALRDKNIDPLSNTRFFF